MLTCSPLKPNSAAHIFIAGDESSYVPMRGKSLTLTAREGAGCTGPNQGAAALSIYGFENIQVAPGQLQCCKSRVLGQLLTLLARVVSGPMGNLLPVSGAYAQQCASSTCSQHNCEACCDFVH